MPPGLIVSKAAAIFFAAGKLRESTTRASPPWVRNWGSIDAILKVYCTGDCTLGPPTAALSSASDFGRSAGKMYSALLGSFAIVALSKPKFFVITSLGVWAIHSDGRKVLSSEKKPWLKTRRNSQPSGPRP